MKRITAVILLMAAMVTVTACSTGKNEPLQKEVEKLEAKAEK